MSNGKSTNVTELFGYKLKKTQHLLRLCMDDALKTLNLTTPQYAVLSQLELKPGISNADLARSAFITPQTMHGIVSNLEKRNLVSRKETPTHGRILSTELTKHGQKTIQLAHALIKKVEKQMFATIDKNNKMILEKLLFECFSNLNNYEKNK